MDDQSKYLSKAKARSIVEVFAFMGLTAYAERQSEGVARVQGECWAVAVEIGTNKLIYSTISSLSGLGDMIRDNLIQQTMNTTGM